MAVYDRAEVRDALDLWQLHNDGIDLEAVRQQTVIKDPGLATFPLTLVETLERLDPLIHEVEWPHLFVQLDEDTLGRFLRELADAFTRAIALETLRAPRPSLGSTDDPDPGPTRGPRR